MSEIGIRRRSGLGKYLCVWVSCRERLLGNRNWIDWRLAGCILGVKDFSLRARHSISCLTVGGMRSMTGYGIQWVGCSIHIRWAHRFRVTFMPLADDYFTRKSSSLLIGCSI